MAEKKIKAPFSLNAICFKMHLLFCAFFPSYLKNQICYFIFFVCLFLLFLIYLELKKLHKYYVPFFRLVAGELRLFNIKEKKRFPEP